MTDNVEELHELVVELVLKNSKLEKEVKACRIRDDNMSKELQENAGYFNNIEKALNLAYETHPDNLAIIIKERLQRIKND